MVVGRFGWTAFRGVACGPSRTNSEAPAWVVYDIPCVPAFFDAVLEFYIHRDMQTTLKNGPWPTGDTLQVVYIQRDMQTTLKNGPWPTGDTLQV
jgi:hypothetical protein